MARCRNCEEIFDTDDFPDCWVFLANDGEVPFCHDCKQDYDAAQEREARAEIAYEGPSKHAYDKDK